MGGGERIKKASFEVQKKTCPSTYRKLGDAHPEKVFRSSEIDQFFAKMKIRDSIDDLKFRKNTSHIQQIGYTARVMSDRDT